MCKYSAQADTGFVLSLLDRFVLMNTETGRSDQYDLGHGLVEKVNAINRERVLKRREFKSPEKDNEAGQKSLNLIEEELKDIKAMMEEIKKAVL